MGVKITDLPLVDTLSDEAILIGEETTGTSGITMEDFKSQMAYTLPTASASTLGGVKVGSGLAISSGTLSVSSAPTATKATQDASGNVITSTYAKTSSLATVATSGKYSDLSGTPTTLKNPNALTFTGGVTGTYDGSSAKSVAIPVVDSAFSLTSTNAIQNKVVYSTVSTKANIASPTFTGTVTAPTLTVTTTLNIPGGKIWIA